MINNITYEDIVQAKSGSELIESMLEQEQFLVKNLYHKNDSDDIDKVIPLIGDNKDGIYIYAGTEEISSWKIAKDKKSYHAEIKFSFSSVFWSKEIPVAIIQIASIGGNINVYNFITPYFIIPQVL